MMNDAVEYKNGQKNNWRLHLWNRIAEIVKDKRNAAVLYLPGDRDLDSFVAQRKGFRSANLIAVEHNKAVVKKLRASKRTVIPGDLLAVMLNWPAAHRVGVVIADLQHGHTKNALGIVWAWQNLEAFSGSVLLVNMQRGRESKSDPGYQSLLRNRAIVGPDPDGMDKNRAVMLLSGMIGLTLSKEAPNVTGKPCDIAHQFIGWRVLPSYRSTPASPMFDSFLVQDYGLQKRYESVHELVQHMPSGDLGDEFLLSKVDVDIRQKISAALAVRRMRLDGNLRCA